MDVTPRHPTGRRALLAGLAAAPWIAGARAQDGRPLQIIVGYPPGGGTDVLARVLAEPLGRAAGRPVVVRNVTGAGGQIAASALLREPDGTAILAINHPDLLLAAAREGAGLRAADFQVIVVDVQDPRVMLVRKDSDIDGLAAFVDRARARPGALAVSVTAGSAQELLAKWLASRLGLDIIVAGYRGGAEASNALLSGDVAASIGDDFARFNLRDSTRALFVGARGPSPRWPEAPTLASALQPLGVALPSPDFLSRYGIYAVPARLKAGDPAAYARLQQLLLQVLAGPEYRDYIARSRLEDLLVGRPGEAFEAAFAADMAAIGGIG